MFTSTSITQVISSKKLRMIGLFRKVVTLIGILNGIQTVYSMGSSAFTNIANAQSPSRAIASEISVQNSPSDVDQGVVKLIEACRMIHAAEIHR